MIVVSMPVRIDLAGGWSDTPPITWEVPSCVVNAAVEIDGVLPITVFIEEIDEQIVIAVIDDCNPFIIDSFDGYDIPESKGSIIKCALKLTDIPLNSGIKLTTSSSLPHGSGLGISSIIAAALLRALYKYKHIEIDDTLLINKVLELEQLLTTNGGWQDQLGAIYPGIKVTHGSGTHNIKLTSQYLDFNDLERSMCIIYTGKTRLAKNLLDIVIHNWHSGNVLFQKNISNLVDTAEEMKYAIQGHNIPKIGELLSTYWEQKKIMATNAEPELVTTLFHHIDHLVYGRSLCGAGGGGFALLITKVPVEEMLLELKTILNNPLFANCSIHKIRIHK